MMTEDHLKLRPIRKVYVYVKTPTTMDKLKPGDVFSMDPADENDTVHVASDDLHMVCAGSEPKPQEGKPEGYFELIATRLIHEDWKRRN